MQKRDVYLSISLLSLIVSTVSEAVILGNLFEARYEPYFWYPLAGGIIGIIFGILAKADTNQGCVVNAIILSSVTVFIVDCLLKFWSLVIICYTC